MRSFKAVRVWLWAFGTALFAQVQQPSARYYPTDQEHRQIYAKLAELSGAAGKLAGDPLYADVAVYLKSELGPGEAIAYFC